MIKHFKTMLQWWWCVHDYLQNQWFNLLCFFQHILEVQTIIVVTAKSTQHYVLWTGSLHLQYTKVVPSEILKNTQLQQALQSTLLSAVTAKTNMAPWLFIDEPHADKTCLWDPLSVRNLLAWTGCRCFLFVKHRVFSSLCQNGRLTDYRNVHNDLSLHSVFKISAAT